MQINTMRIAIFIVLQFVIAIHIIREDRYITVGSIQGTSIIVLVSYTDRNEVIRIISARKLSKREECKYYDDTKRYRFK